MSQNDRRETLRTDVVVVGAGTAGVAAARGAASSGAAVILLERDGFLGGIGSGAWVGTICGAALCGVDAFTPTSSGWPHDFAREISVRSGALPQRTPRHLWYLPYHPLQFRLACSAALQHPSIRAFVHTSVIGAESIAAHVRMLDVLSWGTLLRIECGAVVDCSGESIVSHLLGATTIDAVEYQTPSIVFALTKLPVESEQVARLTIAHDIREAMAQGTLDQAFLKLSVVPGSWRDGEILLKLALPTRRREHVPQNSELSMKATALISEFQAWLPSCPGLLGSATVTALAPSLGVRTGRRMLGSETLSRTDVLKCSKPSNSIALGSWPIEEWLDDREPSMTLLPNGATYGIPLPTIHSKHFDNLFAGGRTISADDGAIASARVIGTCLQTGWAAGVCAAASARGTDPSLALAPIQELIGLR